MRNNPIANVFTSAPTGSRAQRVAWIDGVFALAVSELGGAPNIREYSRLNCDGLS